MREQLRSDEGAPLLGEVALVDGDSRVGKTGLVFLDTLFDENATCHIAYGAGILKASTAASEASEAELDELGLNESTIHTDFMIGGPGGRGGRRRGRRRRRADPPRRALGAGLSRKSNARSRAPSLFGFPGGTSRRRLGQAVPRHLGGNP